MQLGHTINMTIPSPVAAPDCEQHYRYIINDTPRNFDDILHAFPAKNPPRILVFTNSSHSAPRILHDPSRQRLSSS